MTEPSGTNPTRRRVFNRIQEPNCLDREGGRGLGGLGGRGLEGEGETILYACCRVGKQHNKAKKNSGVCLHEAPPEETTGILRHMKYCTAIQNPHADRSMHQEPRTKNQEQDYRKQKIVEDSEKDGYRLL